MVDVTRIIKHSGYSELTMSNDIAILEVATTEATLEASTFAKPICLASRDYTSGEVAYVSGWGTTEEGEFFFYFSKQFRVVNGKTSTLGIGTMPSESFPRIAAPTYQES